MKLMYKNNQTILGKLGLLFMFIILCSPVYAETEKSPAPSEPMFFTIQEGHNNDAMARKALEQFLYESQIKVGRHIPLGIARIDLNDDGVQELFIRLLDDDLFCQQDDCLVYGFAVQPDGFVKIAEFNARTIDILENKTEGTRDLLVRLSNQNQIMYQWGGNLYEAS